MNYVSYRCCGPERPASVNSVSMGRRYSPGSDLDLIRPIGFWYTSLTRSLSIFRYLVTIEKYLISSIRLY